LQPTNGSPLILSHTIRQASILQPFPAAAHTLFLIIIDDSK